MPRTEAGKRLLDELFIGEWTDPRQRVCIAVAALVARIDAIEAEAASLDEERLARALHLARHNHSGLPMSADQTCGPTGHDRREAAAIAKASREATE